MRSATTMFHNSRDGGGVGNPLKYSRYIYVSRKRHLPILKLKSR